MIKNRTFATINCTLHVLDFSIPITRIKIFNYSISNMIRFTNNIFLFSQLEQKGFVVNAWTLCTVKLLEPGSKILFLSKSNTPLKKNLILFYSTDGIVEIWNIDIAKKICSLSFDLIFDDEKFFLTHDKDNIFINFQQRKLFIYNFKKHKKIWVYHGEKIEKVLSVKHDSITFFIKGKDTLYQIKKNKKTLFNPLIQGHTGKLGFMEFYKNNLLLTVGLYDNTIAIHYLSKTRLKFILVIKKSGKTFPPQRIQTITLNKNKSMVENILKKIKNCKKNKAKMGNQKKTYSSDNYFQNLKSKGKIFCKNPNVTLKQLIVKNDSFNPIEIKIGFFFFRNPGVWIMKVFQNSYPPKFSNPIQCEKNLYNVSCIGISNKLDIGIIGYEDNFISFFDINTRTYLLHGKNHNFLDRKFRCKIILCETDSSEIFFLSYCSHGILNLWSLLTLKIEKTLILKGLNLLSWSSKRDLIFASSLDSKIYLIIPQNFYTIRVLVGHIDKIMDILFIKNDRYLISSSFDKTLRVWDLIRNNCSDKIKFKYHPLYIGIKKGEESIYISHENTIGFGEWQLYHKQETKVQQPSKKKFLQKSIHTETNFKFIEDFENSSIKRKKEKSNEKLPNQTLCKVTFFSVLGYFYSSDLNYYKTYLKTLKKILFFKIKHLELKLGKRDSFSVKFFKSELVFSKEFVISFVLIYEELVENLLWGEHKNDIFCTAYSNILKIFKNILFINFYSTFGSKILIDLINLF